MKQQHPIVWSGLFFDRGGYGEEARQFVLALDSIGIDVRVDPLIRHPWQARLTGGTAERVERLVTNEQPDRFIHVVHTEPTQQRRHPDAEFAVARTVFETRGRLPLARLAAMDEIWVASDFNIETFASAGVDRRKLRKIPQTFNAELYRSELAPLDIAGTESRFVFLSLFVWQWRKGWDVLVRAYVEEFAPDEKVVLVLKADQVITPLLRFEDVRRKLYRFIRDDIGVAEHPPITLFAVDLNDEDVARLYRSVNAFVMPSRGEGWGRPYMEAMASGLPTIGTRASGNLEFMNHANSYLIDCVEADVPEHAWAEVPQFKYQRWVEPSIGHLRELMRTVFEERSEAAARGARARDEILTTYAWQPVGRLVAEALGIEAPGRPRSSTPDRIPTVLWEGTQFDNHPASLVNREMSRGLLGTQRVEVTLAAERPPEPAMLYPAWSALAQRVSSRWRDVDVHVRDTRRLGSRQVSSGRLVLMDTSAAGDASAAVIEELHRGTAEVWVASHSARDRYLSAGVADARVHVIHHGVNHVLFTPGVFPLPLSTARTFKFLFVGGHRFLSGGDIVLETYLKAFRAEEDVCLVIKDHPEDRAAALIENLRRLNPEGRHAEVLHLDEDLPDDLMPALYAACDALVHPYRSDATGRVVTEAMACGLPVIVPGEGPYAEFCDPTVAHLVPVTRVLSTVDIVDGVRLAKPLTWVEPDRAVLAAAMRAVVTDPAAAREMGLKASRAILADRSWSASSDAALERIEALAAAPLPEPTTPAVPRSPRRLSVCMMVRNEEDHLGTALESVAAVADQIVVVDVGSTDRTVEIAMSSGAEVHLFDDPDDFGAGRNESLRHADGDWILVLDGDEHLEPSSHEELRAIVDSEDLAGYMVRIRNYTDRQGTDSFLEHSTLRLFPNHPELHYVGRDPHAQLQPRSEDVGFEVRSCGVVLHHEGYRPHVLEEGAKLERNRRALERAVAEEPDNSFHAFNLGLTYSLLGRAEEAERELLRSVALSGVEVQAGRMPLLLPNAYLSLALAVFAQGRYEETVAYCDSALRLAPHFSDAYVTMGSALVRLGRFDGALAAYRAAIESQADPAVAASDRSTATWKPWLGLAEVHAAMGRWEEATECLGRAHEIAPESPDVALGVARASLAAGDLEAADEVLEAVAARDDAPADTWLIRAELELTRERPGKAAEALQQGMVRRPLHEPMFRERLEQISPT